MKLPTLSRSSYASHHIASHRITSYYISSHLITQEAVLAILANELDSRGNEMFLVWWYGEDKPDPKDFDSPHWEPLATVEGLPVLRAFRRSGACQSASVLKGKLKNMLKGKVKKKRKRR